MKDRNPFLYISAVTLVAVILIVANALLGMRIPFRVEFLIGYVGALLVFVAWHAVVTKGWRRSTVMFGLSFAMAFTAEALGVNFGLIFGRYHYTPALGIRLFGVPFLAALAWEPIVYAAFCLAELLSPPAGDQPRLLFRQLPALMWTAAIGALATTAWDMMIDPIAVSQGWWVWHDGGAYVPYLQNGVPIQNFIGWLGVAFAINLAYRLIGSHTPPTRRSLSLAVHAPLMLYTSLFLTSFGVSLTILRRSDVALVGLLSMGSFLTVALANLHQFGTSSQNVPKAFI